MSTAAKAGQATVQLLPCQAPSVAEARRLGETVVTGLMSEKQQEVFRLALSEVVSNAIRHSQSSECVKLAMTPKEEYLCVQVTDGGTGLVPRPGAMETEGGAGFGLFLVERLTRRWGMTREEGQTRVWFEIDFNAGDAGAEERPARRTAA